MFKPTKRYWECYRALHGESQLENFEVKPKKKRRRDEELEQIRLVNWLDEKNVRCFHPRNGGSLNAIEGAKFKRMGVRRGIPDIVIPYMRKGHGGLYIELKKVEGNSKDVSVEQQEWLDFFNRQGYLAVVAFGAEHAKRIVEDYFR